MKLEGSEIDMQESNLSTPRVQTCQWAHGWGSNWVYSEEEEKMNIYPGHCQSVGGRQLN